MRYIQLVFLLSTISGLFFGIHPTLSAAKEVYTVSLRNLSVEQNERVVAFKVRLTAASIHSVPEVPIGWAYQISNSLNEHPPWNTVLDASIGVGNAALHPEFFQNFLIVEKYSGKWVADLKFNVEVELTVTVDFDNYVHKTLGMGDIIVKRVKE
jgi:hypothetical protein